MVLSSMQRTNPQGYSYKSFHLGEHFHGYEKIGVWKYIPNHPLVLSISAT